MAVTRRMYEAYELVRKTGYEDMHGAQALEIANILLRGELTIDMGQWAFIIINYDELKEAYE